MPAALAEQFYSAVVEREYRQLAADRAANGSQSVASTEQVISQCVQGQRRVRAHRYRANIATVHVSREFLARAVERISLFGVPTLMHGLREPAQER